MAILKWIELKCDGCGDVASGLRFAEDMNGKSLREEARNGGWVRRTVAGELLDLCCACKERDRC